MATANGARPVPIPALGDDRIALRAFRADDIEAIVAHGSDPELVRWSSVPTPYSPADAREWQAQAAQGWRTGRLYQFAIEADGRMIGDINLRHQGGGLAEIGFGLFTGHRGRGLMTRALRLLLPWAFAEAGVAVVQWRAQVGNWRSRRVAWAVGFRVGEAVPGLIDRRGTRVDGWIAGLRAGDDLRPAHPWFDLPRITGPALVLRAPQDGDVDRIVQACRDPETRRWQEVPAGYTADDARRHLVRVFTRAASGGAVTWVAADPLDDRLLAEVLVAVNPRGDGEIGYWSHPDARGRGITTEAVRLAARHSLLPADEGGLGLDRLMLRADELNLASLRVAHKAGFTRAGIDRSANAGPDGSRSADIRFDLLPGELPALR